MAWFQSRSRSKWFFQPADELHGALGEPLDGLCDDGCAWVV